MIILFIKRKVNYFLLFTIKCGIIFLIILYILLIVFKPMKDIKSKRQILKNKNNKKRAIVFIFFQALMAVAGYVYAKNKKRIIVFEKAEEKEVEELIHRKETSKDFLRDTKKNLKDFFIPHEGNNHKPHSLRPKSLAAYLVVAIAIKLLGTGFLFFVYPNKAEMSRIVSDEAISLVNKERKNNGLAELRVDPILSKIALLKGEDMIRRGYFAHDTPEGRRPWEWISKTEYDYVYAGENLAMDFSSAELIHEAFMKSPTHRKNILNDKYRDIGIAVVSGEMLGHDTDILIQFFGTKRSDAYAPQKAIAQKPAPQKTEVPAQAPVSIPNSENSKNELAVNTPIATNPSLQNTEAEARENVLGNETTEKIIVVNNTQPSNGSKIVDFSIFWMNVAFIAFLIFITLALLINIVVRFKVQHGSLIMQTLVVIAIISALFITKLHFAEIFSGKILIL